MGEDAKMALSDQNFVLKLKVFALFMFSGFYILSNPGIAGRLRDAKKVSEWYL